ncbi:flagellar basal body-associated FliL family protein [Simplicispira lacusdiani]|uniref:flagellar basal body-associated FliL family protein n=1 Tax=Simplicispira lacusdiani TaxID=2213010 RepID=UPI0018E4EA5C|nr:flagellar basal body-associated FliL family protein [Simplicispira lacusdiani]
MSSNAPAAESAKKPAKSKKLIIIGAVVVLLLVVVGGGAAWFLSKRNAVDEDGEAVPAKAAEPAAAPTFLPMDMMVVNLADNGGERFAQIGITLELADTKTADLVKQHMPSIRNGVLMLASQRTSDELLTREGKEKLADDILREVSRPLGFDVPAAKSQKAADGDEPQPRSRKGANPVRRVLFSGFIIQ